MLNRRKFLKDSIAASILISAGLPGIVNASEANNVYFSPRFENIYGKPNYCARYAILASKHKFGKCFQWKDAWQFAEFNRSVNKIKNMKSKNNFNDYLDFFIDEKRLLPGMIVGTFYAGSSWNHKFYNQKGNVSRTNGINKKPILYTHLMCYAGKNKFEEPVFWHQFPYPKKDEFGNVIRNKKTGKIEKEVLQASIRLRELEKHRLSIKEIIDVPRKYSRRHIQCEREVNVLGYGRKKIK